jgi:hypothetical protein
MEINPMRFNLMGHGRVAAALAGSALLGLLATTPASAGIQAGTLSCAIAAGTGSIIGSEKAVTCTFTPSVPGPIEYYNGKLTRIGLDISQTNAGVFTYSVVEAADTLQPFSLAGTYAGAGAGLTIGVGLGVDALVGGNNNQVALQPLAVSTTSGIGINAGIGGLTLVPAGTGPVVYHRHHRHFHYFHHHHHHHHG